MKQILVSVDRIEGATVILVAEDGREFSVKGKEFPQRPVEGMLYHIPVSAAGVPYWPGAIADPLATARRKKELTERMAKLRSGDSGGDIKL